MKKLLLLAVAILFVTVCEAQNKNKKEPVKVVFYGVDFSVVNVVGAVETEEQFITAFEGINHLLVSEQNKYNVGKYMKLDVSSLQIEHAVDQLEKMKDVKFNDNKESKMPLNEIIRSYPATQGNVLLIVAKELNKSKKKGTFVAVIYDGEKKQIISERVFSGKPGGFGLKNFWARSLYNGLKSYRE